MMWMVLPALAGAFDVESVQSSCDDTEAASEATSDLARLAKSLIDQPVSAGSKASKLRMKKAKKYGKKGLLCGREQMLHAGLVLLGSRKTADLDLAFAYAQEAAADGLDRSHWLAASAFDRSALSQGQKQTFGTQRGVIAGQPNACLYPFEPSTTDEQRKAWSQPTMTETIAAFLEEKGRKGETADERTLARLNLLCGLEDW